MRYRLLVWHQGSFGHSDEGGFLGIKWNFFPFASGSSTWNFMGLGTFYHIWVAMEWESCELLWSHLSPFEQLWSQFSQKVCFCVQSRSIQARWNGAPQQNITIGVYFVLGIVHNISRKPIWTPLSPVEPIWGSQQSLVWTARYVWRTEQVLDLHSGCNPSCTRTSARGSFCPHECWTGGAKGLGLAWSESN